MIHVPVQYLSFTKNIDTKQYMYSSKCYCVISKSYLSPELSELAASFFAPFFLENHCIKMKQYTLQSLDQTMYHFY